MGKFDTPDGLIDPGGAGDFKADGSVPATGDFDMGGFKITAIDDPASDQDAATKKYVDDNAGGGAAVVIVTKAAADSPYALGATVTTLLGNTVAGDLTVTLPAAPVADRDVYIKKIHADNDLVIDGNGKLIDGLATVTTAPPLLTSFHIQYDGTAWRIL